MLTSRLLKLDMEGLKECQPGATNSSAYVKAAGREGPPAWCEHLHHKGTACSGSQKLCSDADNKNLPIQVVMPAGPLRLPGGKRGEMSVRKCREICNRGSFTFVSDTKPCANFCVDGSDCGKTKFDTAERKAQIAANEEAGTCAQPQACNVSDFGVFWGWLIACISVQAIVEIGMLYYYGIKFSVRVAQALDLRLLPLNKDRAFVARSLVRAALEIPNPDYAIFGVDPRKETKGKKSPQAEVFWLFAYKAKIVLTTFAIKVFAKRFIARNTARSTLPYAVIPATALWDSFAAHLVIREAKLRGLGFAAGIELFDEITDGIKMDHGAVLECVRAIGIQVMRCRDFYPSKEVLLRHSVMHLHILQEAKDSDPRLQLDNVALFLEEIPKQTLDVQRAILAVLLVTTMVDGRIKKAEKHLVEAVVEACDDKVATSAGQVVQRLKMLTQVFRDVQNTVTAQHIHNCIQVDCSDGFSLPIKYYCVEAAAWCTWCIGCFS